MPLAIGLNDLQKVEFPAGLHTIVIGVVPEDRFDFLAFTSSDFSQGGSMKLVDCLVAEIDN